MSVNKAILVGNVGKDPEIKIVGAFKVANVTIATSEKGYTKSDGTQVPERTEWHNVILWNGLAEVVEKYLHKGDKVYIEGKIRTRSYEDKSGVRRFTTEIYAEAIDLLSSKKKEESSEKVSPDYGNPPSNTGFGTQENKKDLPF